MQILNTERLYRAVKNKSALDTNFSAIDHGCAFIPERLTQLYYTERYGGLKPGHKLRYNQLFALRAIEQLMTLEQRFIALVIDRSRRSPELRANLELQYCMQEMILEEAEHYRMFAALNRLAEPAIYRQQDLYFAKMTLPERAGLGLLCAMPGITPFMLWTLLILEEFSTYISRQMLRQQADPLGSLEPNFVQAHREHLKDESRHVAICANALNELLATKSNRSRKLNARILRRFMNEFMSPKRGGVRVIQQLCKETPELRETEAVMIDAVRQQSPDPLIWGAINNAAAMPATNELMRRYPEFSLHREQTAPA